MKQIVLSLVMMLMLCNVVQAYWDQDFVVNYQSQGIDVAVSEALKEGIHPIDILTTSMEIKDLNVVNTIKALYCEGADGNDIKKATEVMYVSENLLLAGFDKSVVECGESFADSQAYTPVGQQVSFQPSPSDSNRDASPSTF